MKIDRIVAESKTYGRLRIVGKWHRRGGTLLVGCVCECGTNKLVRYSDMRLGKVRSCGCLKQGETNGNFRHGLVLTITHNSWSAMRTRCSNVNNCSYRTYGGRGIKVCKRWDDFNAFLADMGTRPSKRHSIDRINVNGNYEPGNCRWATPTQQSRNTRRNRIIETPLGEMCVADAAVAFGMPRSKLEYRIDRGWKGATLFYPGRFSRSGKKPAGLAN